jgi:hypothetical protein
MISRYIKLSMFLGFGLLVILLSFGIVHAQSDTAAQLISHVASSLPWYLVRASGLVSAICLFLLMLSGIGFITGGTFSFLEPIIGWATHRAISITLAVSLLIHILTLLLDHFVSFNIVSILIPFVSNYKAITISNVYLGSILVAFGIIAFYLVILVVLSSLFWINKKPLIWRLIHFVSYLTVLLVFIHSFYIGTDLKSGVLHWLWIIFGVILLGSLAARIWRSGTLTNNNR